MESKGDEEKELQGGSWESQDTNGRIQWDDGVDKDTVPLLDDPTGQTIRDWVPSDLSGQWNASRGNPFVFEDWKPLWDPLAEGDELQDHVMDTRLMLNTPINLSPVSKLSC